MGGYILDMTSDRTFIAAEVDAYDEAASVEATVTHDLARPRRSLGPTQAAPASRKAARDQRTSDCPLPPSHGWHPVRAPHRVPVEGAASGVRVRVHMPPSLPGVGRGRHLRAAVGQAADPIRRPPAHPVALAIVGQRHGQSPVGGGRKQAPIRRTAASSARSATCLPINAAPRWPSS